MGSPPDSRRESKKGVGHMATKRAAHPSLEERTAIGNAGTREDPARRRTRTGSRPPTGRIRSPCWRSKTQTREPDLVPVRHGRMMVSPFTFYRGAAMIMAADLKGTPVAGLNVAALRRRAPVQLRAVRLARAAPVVRPERLRRDAPRPVRVGREAHGGQLHDRRAAQRLQQERGAGHHGRGGAPLPERDGGLRRHADARHLVREHVRGHPRLGGRPREDQGSRRRS